MDWQWDPDRDPSDKNHAKTASGVEFEFVREPSPHVLRVGSLGWSSPTPYVPGQQAQMVADEDRVYVALHSTAATGCTVVAFEADGGALAWHTQLIGIGSIGHSKYSNRVQVRLSDGELTIYGLESGGRYIEVLGLAHGTRLRHEAMMN